MEQLRYGGQWVCVVGGWCKVIFVSNPTFELSLGWVGFVTKRSKKKEEGEERQQQQPQSQKQ